MTPRYDIGATVDEDAFLLWTARLPSFEMAVLHDSSRRRAMTLCRIIKPARGDQVIPRESVAVGRIVIPKGTPKTSADLVWKLVQNKCRIWAVDDRSFFRAHPNYCKPTFRAAIRRAIQKGSLPNRAKANARLHRRKTAPTAPLLDFAPAIMTPAAQQET